MREKERESESGYRYTDTWLLKSVVIFQTTMQSTTAAGTVDQAKNKVSGKETTKCGKEKNEQPQI